MKPNLQTNDEKPQEYCQMFPKGNTGRPARKSKINSLKPTQMKKKIYYLCSVIMLLCVDVAFAQINVKGKVYSTSDKLPLPGATVKEKGTTNGRSTASDGSFALTVKKGAVLEFSMLGFKAQSITVGTKTNFEIFLDDDTKSLSDVVIIGYQEVDRKKVTAAVTTIRGEEIENLPAPSLDALLQGRVPGLNVQINNGAPGSSPIFQVRGNSSFSLGLNEAQALSSPLFIIDGIATTVDDFSTFDNTGTNFLAGISTNDIESIDVLRDAAAAAIYGSRGANGVVVVTTKKGKTGKPKVTFNAYSGLTQKPALQQTVLGAEERRMKLDWLNYWAKNENSFARMKDLPMILTDSINPAFNNATDWQDLFYRSGIVQNYDVSVAGAKEGFSYRLALNHYNEEGIIKATGFKRYSLATTLGIDVLKNFRVDGVFRLSRADRSVGRATRPGEVLPITGEGGNFPSSFLYLSPEDIANYTGDFELSKDKNFNDNLQSNIRFEFNPTQHIRLESNLMGSFSSNRRASFQPSVLDENGVAFAGDWDSFNQNLNVNTRANYHKKFGGDNHSINTTIGQEINILKTNSSNVQGYGIPSDQINVVKGVDQQFLYGGSDAFESRLLSYFAQAEYSFKDRYLLSAVFRADASSRFGKNNRWAYFPAISAGWIASDESFMKGLNDMVPLLKIRATYGQSGNQPSSYYLSYNTYLTNQGNYAGSAGGTYNGVIAVTPDFNSVAQPDLTWEKQEEVNIGFDLALFPQSRIYIVGDFYVKDRNNSLLVRPLATTTGYGTVNSNGAGIRNTGAEIRITTHNFNGKNPFQWNTTANFAFNKNRITRLPDGDRDIISGNYIFSVGSPLYEHYRVKSNGVYAGTDAIPVNPYTGERTAHWNAGNYVEPGSFNWADVNGDYIVWDHNDKQRIGNSDPMIVGGFLNDFSYKNFSLGVYTSFTFKRNITNGFRQQQLDNLKQLGNFYRSQIPNIWELDTWQKDGDESKYANLNPYGSYYYQFYDFSSAFIEDGSYLKINNIRLGYRFGESITKRLGMSSLNLYGVVDNVYTFKNKNTDTPNPEQVDGFGRYSGNSYPIPRKYTVGLNVVF